MLFNIVNAVGQVVSSTTVLPRPLTREATLIVNVDPTVLTNLAILNPPDNTEVAVVDLAIENCTHCSRGLPACRLDR